MIGLLLYLLCLISTGLLVRFALRLEDFTAFSLYRLCVSLFWGILSHIVILQVLQLFSLSPSHATVRWLLLFMALIMPVLLALKRWRKGYAIRWQHAEGANWTRTDYLGFVIIWTQLAVLLWLVLVLPLIGWDGWAAWLVKTKVWYFNGLDASFTNVAGWQSTENVYSNLSAFYPDGFPLMQYATALFTGWNETALKAMTWCAWVCFLPCFYHGLRKLDIQRSVALWTTVLLVSIPMFRYHVYSGGYVDLWLAMYLFLCLSAAQSFILNPDKRTFIRFLILLLALGVFKLEGIIWIMLVLVTFALASMSNRNRRISVLVVGLILSVWFAIGGFGFDTPFGPVNITPQLFQFGDYVNYALAFNNTTDALLEALFLSRNWLLIWYMLPVVIWLAIKYHRKSEILMLSVFLLLGALFIVSLFYLTGASKWAENFTSINRVVLHMVPVYLLLGAALLSQRIQERNMLSDSDKTR